MFTASNLMMGLALFQASSAMPHSPHGKQCNPSTLNATVTQTTILSNDTIFSIAARTNRGACDIARYNRMADANVLSAGLPINIPGEVCEPDNVTCLLVEQSNTTADCIFGGPHTYSSIQGDTIEYVALYRFGITVEALAAGVSYTNITEVLPEDTQFKVPQCSPSQCTIQPYQFSHGTYKDLAEIYGTTAGQIVALNPSFNYSTGTNVPVISLPMHCHALSDNITVIS